MLGRCGIIGQQEAEEIIQGLEQVRQDLEEGRAAFDPTAEDIHTEIERLLSERIGAAAGKLHTARSRNDQVATDMRLYLKDEEAELRKLIAQLQDVLLEQAQAEDNFGAILPGYTHLQRAQPVLLSHHLLAYFWMLERDYERLRDCVSRADALPLGAAALAGTAFPINPQIVAEELGFSHLCDNSMDAVSDRDFVVEFLCFAALTMAHLSRLGDEIVLWSSQEFGFLRLSEEWCTGSSIMPHKRNPDIAELVRAKTGRVYGDLIGMLTVLKGLPLTYNRDLQEDKEALFDAADTLAACLQVSAKMLRSSEFVKDRIARAGGDPLLLSTDLADYLVKKGLSFREAHQLVGKVVSHCEREGLSMRDLSLDQWKQFSPLIGDDLPPRMSAEASVTSKTSHAGTSPESVREQFKRAKELLGVKRTEP
jgi:argininosuccinate lyase